MAWAMPSLTVVVYRALTEELAKKAGVTYSTLIKLESGVNKNPTIKTIQQIAAALEVSLDELTRK
jgi:transcriptional regulator with XRE-family HTH domain